MLTSPQTSNLGLMYSLTVLNLGLVISIATSGQCILFFAMYNDIYKYIYSY